jgi:hypothetical protein
MNPKDCILIDEAFHKKNDLAFSLWDTEGKEGNPITLIYKIVGESKWKLSKERS